MQPSPHQRLTELLIAARHDSRQIAALPPDLQPASIEDAYAINARVAAGLGWPQLGWKIAATTPEMQQRLRTSEPIYGRTYQRFATPSPACFRHSELLDPLIECEFFFRLGRDVPPRAAPYTRMDIAAAVSAVHAGIEVAECRFPLANLPSIPAILADGAASGRYVIGDAFPQWHTIDFVAMPVALSVNGQVRREGHGRDVMGDPINALVWLANARSKLGSGLFKDALISTGTATGMLLAKSGDVMRATFGATHIVDLAFDA